MYGFSAYAQTAYSALPDTTGGGTVSFVNIDETVNVSNEQTQVTTAGVVVSETARGSNTQTVTVDFVVDVDTTAALCVV